MTSTGSSVVTTPSKVNTLGWLNCDNNWASPRKSFLLSSEAPSTTDKKSTYTVKWLNLLSTEWTSHSSRTSPFNILTATNVSDSPAIISRPIPFSTLKEHCA